MSKERFSNRIARVFLGVAFAVIAFVLEWRVVKAIKKGQLGEKKPGLPKLAATGTADGLKVTPDE